MPEPKDEEASYSHEITKEAGLIDWNASAEVIWRQVRAYQPWPEAYTYWQGKQFKIIEAVPLQTAEPAEAGRVIDLKSVPRPPGVGFGAGTGNGVLGVIRVQIEGKRVMPAEEFVRGQRGFQGSSLGV